MTFCPSGCRPFTHVYCFFRIAALALSAVACAVSGQTVPWCEMGSVVRYPSVADGSIDCSATSFVEYVAGNPGAYRWTTTPGTAYDSACWWEILSDHNHRLLSHTTILHWAQIYDHPGVPTGYPLGVHLASTPPAGDFLPPSPILQDDSVALLPPGSANASTWWDDLGRATVDQKIDLVTGLPLISSRDLELPFGGATFRLNRTRSAKHPTGRVISGTWGSQAWWDWAGEGWMVSENPLLMIDSAVPDLVGDRPSTCWLWLDAHRSIPFQYIESNDQYAAPPRFRARMHHNGNRFQGEEPTQFEVWLYDGQLKYTFVVVPEDVPPNVHWNPEHQQTPPDSVDFPHPVAGSTTFHNRPYSPDQIFAADENALWHDPWGLINNPGVGLPRYGLCVKIEDRFGHTVEIDYHTSGRSLAESAGVGCEDCVQQSRRKGLIKRVRLSTDGITNWTLVYRHRMIWRDLPTTSPGAEFGMPNSWTAAGASDAYKEAFSFPVIDRIYAFEHEEDGAGVTQAQVDALQSDLIVLEQAAAILEADDLDRPGPLDDFGDASYQPVSGGWASIEDRLRYIVSYHYTTPYLSGVQYDPALVKSRNVSIENSSSIRITTQKVFKYTPSLSRSSLNGTNTTRAEGHIAWLEAVFTDSAVKGIMLAKEAEEDPIPLWMTVNHLALWQPEQITEGVDLDSSGMPIDQSLAEQLRESASLLIGPGLYDLDGYPESRWPNTASGGGTWDSPSPGGLHVSPNTDGRAYLSALGGDYTARNDGNWSTVGTASITDSSGAKRHLRIHRLMAFSNADDPNGGLASQYISPFLKWGELSGEESIDPANVDWLHYGQGGDINEEASGIGVIHASVFVSPYFLRSYERHANDSLVGAGDLTKPRWIAILDEFDSRDSMMDKTKSYGGDCLRKDGQISRRVVEMNAYGYILRDRTWTFTEDGFIREGGGLGEEYAYVTIEDYVDFAQLPLPSWLDNDENGGQGDGAIDHSADLRVFLDEIVQVEHRSVGWSVADNDPAIDELSNGIVRFIEYGMYGESENYDEMPLSVRFQRTAEGIKRGMYFTGSDFDPGPYPLYTRQYFRDPLRPSDVTADVAFSGSTGPSVKLSAPPEINQSPDPDLTVTRVLSKYGESGSSGDSALDRPLVARMVIGPPRQVRPGSEWFYPVEVEHYVDGVTEWSATGQLSHPTGSQSAEDVDLLTPNLSGNTSPHNSLTWTYYSRDRYGRSDYTVLDAGAETEIVLPSNEVEHDLPSYPGTWVRFPSESVAPAHNYITDFEYNQTGLIDVYYPNRFRWAWRLYSEDTNDDDVIDFTHEFIFNDLTLISGTSAYAATSPGQYKRYEGEDAVGIPEFDRRVRFLVPIDIDNPQFLEDTLVRAIRMSEIDPQAYSSPIERLAQVLFAVDANGRLQRADLMDFDPLGRAMAIGSTEVNDLGEIYRERGIDGTIRTQIRNSLGQTLRRYTGTVDKGWFGTHTDADNMVLKERVEYGAGVHDAWLPTVVRRYVDHPSWDNGYDAHFEQAQAIDSDGIPMVTRYDWRMRPVVTQSFRKGDLSGNGVLSSTVTYLDHADRPVLEATFGQGNPGLTAGIDPSTFAENDPSPSPEQLYELAVPPTSVVASVYGPDGTLVERRVYDTDWVFSAVGSVPYISEIMLNGLGGQPVYGQSVGSPAEITRIDNLGRVAQVASVVPGTVTPTEDGYELTRSDHTYDTNGNVTMVRRWERVIDDTDPVLNELNAVCSTTVSWYDEKKRLVATAELGTEDEGGVYENPAGTRYEWEAVNVPYYLPATGLLYTQHLPATAQTWLYVYGDGNPFTPASEDDAQMSYAVDPSGMVTQYEYTGTGQVWRKIENVTALLPEERRCTQYEYRYGKVQQIIAYERYPIPPPVSDESGLLVGVPYQQTIVAYDDAGDASGLDPDNANGEYGGEVVDSTYAVVSRDGSLITTVHLPDPVTGAVNEASPESLDLTETFRLRYNFAGQVAERIDAEDRSFRYLYDDLGRVEEIRVGHYTGGSYADGYADTVGVPADRVARVDYTYDAGNRLESVTAFDLSGNVVAQNVYQHDGRDNITREYQQYGAPVATSTSPFIEYEWDFRATEFGTGSTQVLQVLHPGHDRVASIHYPVPVSTHEARELTFGYGSTDSHADKMSWLESIGSNLGSPQVAQFGYLGNGRRVSRHTAGGEIEWVLHDDSSVSLVSLDSFGRVTRHAYSSGSGPETFYHALNTYDTVGNLLAQVKKKSTGAMLRHYTYDGLGRLIKSTYASGFANRVEHHHYDGVRRIQTVVASNVMSAGDALASGDPGLQSMAMASEPSGESTDQGNTNLAFTTEQLSATGQTFTVHREYVWGPGDSSAGGGVDELLVYYDSGDDAWWCLTDLTGDLIAVCDLGGAGGAARVCAQWTYDAYGSVMSADHIHAFEKPSVGHKGLFVDRLDLSNALGHQLVPFAQSIYHNRNRVYVPQLGRFLQQDPNQSAMALIAASPFHAAARWRWFSIWSQGLPDVVPAIGVGEHAVGIDGDAGDGAFTGLNGNAPGAGGSPDLDGQFHPLGRAVAEGDVHVHRHDHVAQILECDARAALAEVVDGRDGLIECRGREEPPPPEPREVHARGVLHRAEEIRRLRVLEGPGVRVGFPGVIEPLGPEDPLAQEVQRPSGLGVVERANPPGPVAVGRGVRGLAALGAHHAHDPLHTAAARSGFTVEIIVRVDVDERVEPLVHPHVPAFVGVDEHRVPVVPDLVVGDAEEARVVGLGAAEDHHRVLHPALGPVDVGHLGVGVGVEPLGVELDGVLDVLRRAARLVRELAVPVPGLGLLGVKRFAEDVACLAFKAGDRRVAAVHDEGIAGREGDGSDILGLELPGQGPLARGAALQGADLLGGDDEDGRVRAAGRLDAAELLGGEHLLGVLERARRVDDELTRHGDVHLEVAEVGVELAVADVGERVPAVDIVVLGDVREPLGIFEDRALLNRLCAHAAQVRGHVEAEGHLEFEGLARGDGLGQLDAGEGVVDLESEIGARGAEVGDVVPAVEGAEVGGHHAARGAALRAERIGLEEVLLELEPEVLKLVRRVVVVGDGHRRVEALGLGLQLGLDDVIGPLLPPVGPGLAGAEAHGVRGGQIERGEDVGDRVARDPPRALIDRAELWALGLLGPLALAALFGLGGCRGSGGGLGRCLSGLLGGGCRFFGRRGLLVGAAEERGEPGRGGQGEDQVRLHAVSPNWEGGQMAPRWTIAREVYR